MFLVQQMASKNNKYWAKTRGFKDTEWVAETIAVVGTDTSSVQRDNIVRSQIRVYGLAKGIDDTTGTGDNKSMDFLEYIMQTIEELTLHMAKFCHYLKGAQTDNIIQFIATLDYFTQNDPQSA